MNINATVGLLQLAAVMSEDVLAAAKIQEALGLQNNKILLSQLSSFQIILDDVYKTSRPSSNDYANRRDLIRIFNEIAKEIYGNNGQCPVVEIFGSFVMDMFNAESDLDMSINFSDKSFESDRVAKRKILRKFAKKFYALRKKGHVTTVELILSARVPVLKVTDSGSGIECDLSVGNRDGIAKSHIVRLISTIDERFQKLSFMMKAWAKAHDINSSKDGTLNSLSLILLAAFHLQTRDIPILPPFSYIFKDGMDPATVKLCLPGFSHYGKKNKESLAELFLSLLVKLQSVETLWPRGLCASTYEGMWICRNPNATEYFSIEDFTDRTQNTARAVKSAHVNKIYSCIHRSVEHIRSFTAGIIDAKQLKNLLFGQVPPIPSKVCPTPTKIKLLTQKSSTERIGPGEQGKHGHNICHVEAPTSSKASGVKILKSRAEKSIDPQNSANLTSFQGSDNTQQESLTPNHSNVKKKCPTQGVPADGQRPGKQSKLTHNSCNTETSNPSHKKKKCPAQMGPAEGQRPVKQGKHSHNLCSMETPTPSKTKKVKKKKSKIGRKTNPVASNTPTSVQGSDKLQKSLTENPSQKVKKLPGQGCLEEGQRPGRPGKKSHNPCSNETSTASRRNKFNKLGAEKKFGPVTSDTRQPLPVLSTSGSGGYSSQTLHRGQLYSALPNQGSGEIRPLSTPHVRNFNQAASSSAANERPYLYNLANKQCQGYRPQNMHADTLSLVAPRFPEGHPPYFSNPQSSGGFAPSRTCVDTWRHAAPNFPQREILSSSGYGGFNLEKNHFETSRSAVPSFPSDRPVSHSDYQHSQGYGGFRSEGYHTETLRYTPAAPWVSVSNQRVQVPGELLPGMHVETSSYSASKRYSPSLANVTSGVGPERKTELINHATPSFQTPSYTLSSRSSTSMPPQQPYIPTGFQRSHDSRQSYPVVPSQFALNMHPYRY